MNDPTEYRYPNDKVGFYVAASDQEMLAQVSRLMSRSGYIGIMDTAGRMQYLIDGRRGPPYAARRIVESAGRLLGESQATYNIIRQSLTAVIDQILASHGLRTELRGYRYLRYILMQAGQNETLLRPICKTLYPAAATQFHVSCAQVERDIRYALHKSDFHQSGLSAAPAICHLHSEIMQMAEQQNG